MLYLIPIPIVIVAAIVDVVATKYKMKITKTISKVIIILGVLFFLYTFAAYNGFDVIKYVLELFK